jgi:aminoglycoside 3'-phosphotransferase-2
MTSMSSAFHAEIAPTLPDRLAYLGAAAWSRVTLGKSDAAVWCVKAAGERLFLKISPVHPLSETPGEISRLRWLSGTPVAAPHIREAFEADGSHWLVMTALPGRDLTHLIDRPADLVAALASCLRSLHRLDIASCPFDQSLDAKLAAGAANAAAGLVDETDFDMSRVGATAAQVLDWVRQHRPTSEDLVVCHGDASLPNILAEGPKVTGIVDCGRLGVADRWQDLAIACRSIVHNCGEAHVPAFLAAYGAEWNDALYSYYRTLDELF